MKLDKNEMDSNQKIIKLNLFNKQNGRCYYTNAVIKKEDLTEKTYIDVIESKRNKEKTQVLAINRVRLLLKARGLVLSKKLNLFFCHIPKNGGNSLRVFLDPIDDNILDEETKMDYCSRLIDINHLPLFLIQKELPDLSLFIKESESYAILRDPYERFVSSMAQRMRMYKNVELGKLSKEEINNEIEQTINYLQTKKETNSFLDSDYIHFQRQVDYIFLNGEQVIKNLYLISEIKKLMINLQQEYPNSGLKYIEKKEHINATSKPKNIIGEFITTIYRKSQMSKMAPRRLVNYIKSIYFEDFKSTNSNELFVTSKIKNFISDYYSDDIKIYNELVLSRGEI